MNKNSAEFKRLRWSCRRGMLELDILLGQFLEEAFLDLSFNDQDLFIRFLSCEDQVLFCWLIDHQPAETDEFQYMVNKVRAHAEA